ncbi:MAG: GNAT family N-acetyltransferase [Eubacterium sp.]|nr:GNAT family N-acetyltransferase [Eubacterium sp.]
MSTEIEDKTDIDKVRFLEKNAADGFAALESKEYDGWRLGFTEGYTRRTNSVIIEGTSAIDIDEKIAYCEKEYKEHNLPCIFKLADVDNDLKDRLLQRGYRVVCPTDVMTLELKDENLDFDISEVMKDAEFSSKPDDWFETYFRFEEENDPKNRELCMKIHSNVKTEQVYIKILHEGKVVAVASLSIEDGYSLLHNVVVDASCRGLGLGKKLCRAAIAKSKECGAEYSYLQVIEENEIAINLYKKLGYEKLYTYNYMRKDVHLEKTYPEVDFEEVKEEELEELLSMQIESFMPLYEKYHDEISPALESIERIRNRAAVPNRKYFFILKDGERVGVINVGHNDPNEHEVSFISPIFVLPKYQNQGLAYAAIQKAFSMYPNVKTWKLDTIKQEKGNCHLYEKCGFRRVGDEEQVNDKMTLVFYEYNR